MRAHTPGPLAVFKLKLSGLYQVGHPDNDRADAQGESIALFDNEADAKLFVAAHDLLAALICLIPQTFTGDFKKSAEIAHWERERDLGNEYAPSVLAAFAAIAKASA